MHEHPPRRLQLFDYLGYWTYSIRFRTAADRRVFIRQDNVSLVLEQILRAAADARVAVLAYCFMPDHVHIVATGTGEASDGRRFIFLAKQYSGYIWRRTHAWPLWQRYAFERTLRRDEDVGIVVRYVLANPVRDGLVARVEDYPFVGSAVMPLKDVMECFVDAS